MHRDWQRGPYTISTDPERLDREVIHAYLSASYWAEGRSRAEVDVTLEHSLCFGLYRESEQVGFARVVSDQLVIAWLADVFVLEEHRGRGLGLWLAQTVTSDPRLAKVRRWMLGTRDAHGLYDKLGFRDVGSNGLLMERLAPGAPRFTPAPRRVSRS